jgi:hypothetical protein
MYKRLKIENYDKLHGQDLGLGFCVQHIIMTPHRYRIIIKDETGSLFDIDLVRESKTKQRPHNWEMKHGNDCVRLYRDDVADIETFKRRLFSLVDPLPF